MDAVESLEIIGEIASQQWGLCTTKQARAEGITPLVLTRLEKRGGLIRVRHGVYATVGTVMSPALDVKAQWLALRPEMMAADRIHNLTFASESVISHTTAAELWGIGDLWPDGIHFTVNTVAKVGNQKSSFIEANSTTTNGPCTPNTTSPSQLQLVPSWTSH